MNSKEPDPHYVDSGFNNASKKLPLSTVFLRADVDREDKKQDYQP